MMGKHRINQIWQERPGEVSYSCKCGTVYKHQRLPVLSKPLWCCAGPEVEIDGVLYGPKQGFGPYPTDPR